MTISLTDMRANVKLKVGNKAGIDNTIDDNLNKATLHVLSVFRPQDMWDAVSFATTNKKSEYVFADSPVSKDDVYAILMVRDVTKDREILRGSMRHYNRLRQDTAVAGTLGDPRRWTRLGNQLVLYARIPDSATRTVKMTYLKRPAKMTPTVLAFPLNDEWARPVEEYAAYLTWLDLNEGNKAAFRLQAYQELVSTMDKPEAIEDEAPEAALRPYVDMGEL